MQKADDLGLAVNLANHDFQVDLFDIRIVELHAELDNLIAFLENPSP